MNSVSQQGLRRALIGCTARRVKTSTENAPVSSTADPIDPLLVELLALFAGPLATVSFPEVDHTTLSALADRVRKAATEVEAARGVLEQREQALEEAQSALLTRGRRALAYARVYAESDDTLRASLDALGTLQSNAKVTRQKRVEPKLNEVDVSSEEQSPPASKRRGRPRKNPLPSEGVTTEVSGTDAPAENDVAAAE